MQSFFQQYYDSLGKIKETLVEILRNSYKRNYGTFETQKVNMILRGLLYDAKGCLVVSVYLIFRALHEHMSIFVRTTAIR